jgi:uncharacterized protein YbaP (TraB family)
MRSKSFFARALCIFLLTGTVLTGTAQARSPVWKISQADRYFYLGGTLHILAESDYPLPKAFDDAYDHSETLVFETDIQKSRDPTFTKIFMGKMVYSDNRTLKKLLTPDTFKALTIFAVDRGLAPEVLNRFKPGLVLVSLTLLEAERLGIGGIGVDEFFFSKAVKDGRTLRHLESLEQQISFFETLGQGNEDALIAYIIRDLSTLPDLLPVIKSAWKTGDVLGLDRAILAPLKHEFPQIYHTLFTDRNKKWIPKIQKMAATPAVEFILVGAAHLAGEKGLLHLLENQGFTLTNQ